MYLPCVYNMDHLVGQQLNVAQLNEIVPTNLKYTKKKKKKEIVKQ